MNFIENNEVVIYIIYKLNNDLALSVVIFQLLLGSDAS